MFLQDLPAIPLWYNGMWSMVNTKYWTGWPSAQSGQYTPTSWRNYWQMTAHRHAHQPEARQAVVDGARRR